MKRIILSTVMLAFATGIRAQVNFAPVKQIPVDIGPTSVAIGDFNGDGHPDVVTASDGGTVIQKGHLQ